MYGRMLRRAANVPPTPNLEAARPVYICGKDRHGRPALIIVTLTLTLTLFLTLTLAPTPTLTLTLALTPTVSLALSLSSGP